MSKMSTNSDLRKPYIEYELAYPQTEVEVESIKSATSTVKNFHNKIIGEH